MAGALILGSIALLALPLSHKSTEGTAPMHVDVTM
jgi:hypothetical protein